MDVTDQSLVSAVLAGQLDAFDELMRRYERVVFRAAWGFGKSRDNALDITQQVFLKAYRGLAGFRHDADMKTWLLRIAYHEGVNWVRAQGRRHEVPHPLDENLKTDQTQERSILASEREAMLERELARLNRRYRTAIELRYRQGLPISEVAAVLDCSEGVAKNILFRSLRTLRQALAPLT